MTRMFVVVALVAAALLALPAVAPADAASSEASAAAAKTRAQKLRACLRSAARKPAPRARRRARATCRRRFGKKRAPATQTPAPEQAPPSSGESQPAAPSGPFAAPGRDLSGNEAFDSIKGYFLDSRFTDCPAGWPACAVEDKYVHCSNGGMSYRRLTPSSGSDINSVGTFQVTGAEQKADGAWGVEYIADFYGSQSFYSWNVGTDGIVVGRYWAPGNAPPSPPSQNLGPLQWLKPGGEC